MNVWEAALPYCVFPSITASVSTGKEADLSP